jgi:hypothetical protein
MTASSSDPTQVDVFTACETCLDILGVSDPDRRAHLRGYFEAFAQEYWGVNLAGVQRPQARQIVKAMAEMVKSARRMDGALNVLLAARQTAGSDCDDVENCRRVAFPLMAETVMAAVGRPVVDDEGEPIVNWDGGYENPLAGVFSRMASQLETVAAKFVIADFDGADTRRHPALVKLICKLANIYEVETGRKPVAPRTGDRPEYHSPFERFVRAYAPIAGIERQLTAKLITGALQLYHLEGEKI